MQKEAIAIFILVSTIALVGAVPCSGCSPTSGNGISTSPKAVKTLTTPAVCKDLREQTLMKDASDTSNPKELIAAGLQVAMQHYNAAVESSIALRDSEKNLSTAAGLKVCTENLELGVEELKSSSDKFGQSHTDKLDDSDGDLTTWISAAISYQAMCMDTMEDKPGNALETLEKVLPPASDALGNILSCIDDVSKTRP